MIYVVIIYDSDDCNVIKTLTDRRLAEKLAAMYQDDFQVTIKECELLTDETFSKETVLFSCYAWEYLSKNCITCGMNIADKEEPFETKIVHINASDGPVRVYQGTVRGESSSAAKKIFMEQVKQWKKSGEGVLIL